MRDLVVELLDLVATSGEPLNDNALISAFADANKGDDLRTAAAVLNVRQMIDSWGYLREDGRGGPLALTPKGELLRLVREVRHMQAVDLAKLVSKRPGHFDPSSLASEHTYRFGEPSVSLTTVMWMRDESGFLTADENQKLRLTDRATALLSLAAD